MNFILGLLGMCITIISSSFHDILLFHNLTPLEIAMEKEIMIQGTNPLVDIDDCCTDTRGKYLYRSIIIGKDTFPNQSDVIAYKVDKYNRVGERFIWE